MISNKPFKICKEFGCDRLTKETYCNEHKHIQRERETKRHKEYNTQRDSVLVKFYNSKEWRALRDYIMGINHFLCIQCSVTGSKPVVANVVDHIVPTTVDWSLRLDHNNCQPLCHSCHNKKTSQDNIKYS